MGVSNLYPIGGKGISTKGHEVDEKRYGARHLVGLSQVDNLLLHASGSDR